MSNKVLYTCLSKGFIKKERPIFIFTHLTIPYSLTEQGKKLVGKRYSIKPYKNNINQVEHDYVLGSIYNNLSKNEQDSWITETSLIVKYPLEVVVDGVYKDNNNLTYGVEVITESYSKSDIQEKLNFIKKYCNKEIVIYTKDI